MKPAGPAKRPVPVDVESHRQYALRVIDGGIEADPRVLARDVLALADEVLRLREENARLTELAADNHFNFELALEREYSKGLDAGRDADRQEPPHA